MVFHSNTVTKTRLTILQEISLFAVLLTIPLFRLGTQLIDIGTLTLAKVFVIVTFSLWITNILINRDSESIIALIREKANIAVLLFLAFSFISLINARYVRDETFAELFVRIKMLILYFLIVGIIKDRLTLKRAVLVFIVASLLTTSVGLYELATGEPFFKATHRYGVIAQKQVEGLTQTTYGEASRVQGLYSDSGFHAHAMVIFFGLTVPWLFYTTSKKIKIFVGIILSCYVLNIIGTGARVGWVSLICALFVFLILLKHRYKYTLWVICIISIIIIFLASSLIPHLPTFERLQYSKDASFSWRLDTYRQAFEMVRDHPLFGVGTGNYLTEYHNYLSSTPGLSRYFMGWLHNSYLQIWAENGTIGLLFFLFFLLSLFIGLLTTYLKAVDLQIKTLSLCLITAFTGYAVEFTGVPILGQELGWVLLGLSVALITIARKERQDLQDSR